MRYYYRPHRGSLDDAMKEAKSFRTLEGVKQHVVKEWSNLPGYEDITDRYVTFEGPEHNDSRIGWRDVNYVMLKGHVCGMVGRAPKLKELQGEHKLSGVDYTHGTDGEMNVRFCLDGVTYLAVENPDDGYRSYMEDLRCLVKKCDNTFPPQDVVCTHKSSGRWGDDDILEIVDAHTEKLILRIGTEDVTDYYPCCVVEYHPENMAINLQGRL